MHKKTLLDLDAVSLIIRLLKKSLCVSTFEGKTLVDYLSTSTRQPDDADKRAIRELVVHAMRFLKAMGLDTYDDNAVHGDPDESIPVTKESAAARAKLCEQLTVSDLKTYVFKKQTRHIYAEAGQYKFDTSFFAEDADVLSAGVCLLYFYEGALDSREVLDVLTDVTEVLIEKNSVEGVRVACRLLADRRRLGKAVKAFVPTH